MMYSVADNAKDEVYEIAQLLINDVTVLSVGFLNDGASSQWCQNIFSWGIL